MDAPVGGDCGGMTAEAGSLSGKEPWFEETNGGASARGAGLEKAGAKTKAGRVGLTVQQLPSTLGQALDIAAQQLCAVLFASGRQVSAGAAKAAINMMATAARWKTPCNMVSAYTSARFLR